jgi:hypothetical protein
MPVRGAKAMLALLVAVAVPFGAVVLSGVVANSCSLSTANGTLIARRPQPFDPVPPWCGNVGSR